MRPLSEAMLLAQRSSSSQPWVRVKALDRTAGIARLRFQRIYAGPEAAGPQALTVPTDGSLVRARIDSTNNTLYTQRVADPSTKSDFTPWISMGSVSGDVALCSSGAEVLLFHVSTNRRTLYVRASSNSGVSFGQALYVGTAPSPVAWLAAALKSDGTALLLYATDNGRLHAIKRADGAWLSPRLWSNSLSRINGVAVLHDGDWNVVVAGRDSTGNKSGVWSTILGDGVNQPPGTWSNLKPITESQRGANFEYSAPFLDHPDVNRLFFVERVTGAEGHDHPFHTFSPPSASWLDNLWREPAAFNADTEHGLSIGHTTTHAWLSAADGVWWAPLNSPALELSEDVVSVTGKESPRSSSWSIELRNDDGRYSRPGDGDLGLLAKGSEVRVELGYVTALGGQSSPCAPVWIDGLEHRRTDGSASLVVHATGGWGLLSWQQARRIQTWSAGEAKLFQILRSVLARAGFELARRPGNFLLDNHRPEFIIEESEPLDLVVERLMSHLPDSILIASAGGFDLGTPSVTEESAYSYGKGHGIREARYLDPVPRHSRAIVFGSGHTGDLTDWSDFPALFDQPMQVTDPTLDTQQKVDARAQAEARRIAIYRNRGRITIPVNVGQEVYDIIEVTDPAAGLASAERRVLGIETRYAVGPRGSKYEQIVDLGGV